MRGKLVHELQLLVRVRFGDGLALWLSSEHLLLLGDGLGLGFWVVVLE